MVATESDSVELWSDDEMMLRYDARVVDHTPHLATRNAAAARTPGTPIFTARNTSPSSAPDGTPASVIARETSAGVGTSKKARYAPNKPAASGSAANDAPLRYAHRTPSFAP